MNWTEIVVMPLVGGALIGVAAGGLMYLNGRIAGISGIFGGLLEAGMRPKTLGSEAWRGFFVAGLLLAGVAFVLAWPGAFPASVESSNLAVITAGLLVGFGTRLGSGCTSGHGVCGISRLSARSIVATVTFIATGAITVLAVRTLA